MGMTVYPPANSEIAERRKQLAPDIHDAFQEFSRQVFAAGALDEKTKTALRTGADEQELMEANWVAAEMRAGGAYAHSTLALETAGHTHGPQAA
jgi:alkylhydroperoxidase/carboxymuconolactone decarboxylase family protein YurZ